MILDSTLIGFKGSLRNVIGRKKLINAHKHNYQSHNKCAVILVFIFSFHRMIIIFTSTLSLDSLPNSQAEDHEFVSYIKKCMQQKTCQAVLLKFLFILTIFLRVPFL